MLTSEEWRHLLLKKVKKCPMCNLNFRTTANMRRHYVNIHESTRRNTCIICDKRFKSTSHRKVVHRCTKKKKIYECAYCSKTHVTRVALVEHISSHIGQEVHCCGICSSNFNSDFALKQHLTSHEPPARTIKETSEEFVETGKITIKEWDDMVKQRVKMCPICKRTYTTAKDMRRHVREVHCTARPYKCNLCGKCFKSERHIGQHKRRLHLGIKKVVHLNFECFHCAGKFTSRTHLADHMTSHTGIKNHTCNICQSTYTTARGLRRHNKNHLRETGVLRNDEMYKCDQCGKLFIEQSEMVKHRDWVHGDKCNLCKVCGARVKGNIKEHMRVHTGERPVCCHICGKKLRGKLREHLLTHSGERPFGCEICGSTFKYKHYLGVHMRKHTGERPYVCSYCGHSFAARPAFTLHLKRHTEREVPRGFECEICKNQFPNEEALKSHFKEHLGLTINQN